MCLCARFSSHLIPSSKSDGMYLNGRRERRSGWTTLMHEFSLLWISARRTASSGICQLFFSSWNYCICRLKRVLRISIGFNFWWPKTITTGKILTIFYQTLQYTYPCSSKEDVLATGEAFSPQKRISSRPWIFFIFFYLWWVSFALLDLDPADQNQCGSGSATLLKSLIIYGHGCGS
jgi:hypothetical protein